MKFILDSISLGLKFLSCLPSTHAQFDARQPRSLKDTQRIYIIIVVEPMVVPAPSDTA